MTQVAQHKRAMRKQLFTAPCNHLSSMKHKIPKHHKTKLQKPVQCILCRHGLRHPLRGHMEQVSSLNALGRAGRVRLDAPLRRALCALVIARFAVLAADTEHAPDNWAVIVSTVGSGTTIATPPTPSASTASPGGSAFPTLKSCHARGGRGMRRAQLDTRRGVHGQRPPARVCSAATRRPTWPTPTARAGSSPRRSTIAGSTSISDVRSAAHGAPRARNAALATAALGREFERARLPHRPRRRRVLEIPRLGGDGCERPGVGHRRDALEAALRAADALLGHVPGRHAREPAALSRRGFDRVESPRRVVVLLVVGRLLGGRSSIGSQRPRSDFSTKRSVEAGGLAPWGRRR